MVLHFTFKSAIHFELIFVKGIRSLSRGAWVAQSVKRLPLGQVMIPGSWDQALHWAPCSAGRLASPFPSASHSLCQVNK